jgi:hypothetical protein
MPSQVRHWHTANLSWTTGSGISQTPSVIHRQGHHSPHYWSQLDPLTSPRRALGFPHKRPLLDQFLSTLTTISFLRLILLQGIIIISIAT